MRINIFILLLALLGCQENKIVTKKIDGYLLKGYFINDIPNGTIQYYSVDGRLLFTKEFVNGFEIGLCVTFYPNGTIQSRVNLIDGKKHGFEEQFDTMEFLTSKSYFFYGRNCGATYIYDDNKISLYRFTDFEGHELVNLKYDSAENVRQIYIDSISTYYSVSYNEDLKEFNFLLLMPMPPKLNFEYILKAIDSSRNVISYEKLFSYDDFFIERDIKLDKHINHLIKISYSDKNDMNKKILTEETIERLIFP